MRFVRRGRAGAGQGLLSSFWVFFFFFNEPKKNDGAPRFLRFISLGARAWPPAAVRASPRGRGSAGRVAAPGQLGRRRRPAGRVPPATLAGVFVYTSGSRAGRGRPRPLAARRPAPVTSREPRPAARSESFILRRGVRGGCAGSAPAQSPLRACRRCSCRAGRCSRRSCRPCSGRCGCESPEAGSPLPRPCGGCFPRAWLLGRPGCCAHGRSAAGCRRGAGEEYFSPGLFAAARNRPREARADLLTVTRATTGRFGV